MHTNCRFCGHSAHHVVADLGMQPLSNALRAEKQSNDMERFYPLGALVCEHCLLVQAPGSEEASEIFSEHYPYFSSCSDTWLAHARDYAREVTGRFGLNGDSLVVEIACNDGYLLRWFLAAGIPVLGVEPTLDTAQAARALGIPVNVEFFGRAYATRLREQGFAADLMPANNVVAHVPDINDFVGGFAILLKENGVATFEFHHALNLLEKLQFDTIYHEHFYYHSLTTFKQILEANGLALFDVEELPTHGGSLRVYAQRADTGRHALSPRVAALLAKEREAGLDQLATYLDFNERVVARKQEILQFLIDAKRAGKRIAAVGAPAKGNTLLNYLGVRGDTVRYTVDHTPAKQGMYLPGSHIPVKSPEQVFIDRPDYLILLPWNWRDELMQKFAGIREWGGRFVVFCPEIEVIE
ncbi:class I SAM-dependent methyltransferase [Crenobacter intestini]|uniref:Class I SAM-dependent methyltransferase n=1 Tax=Crenobacter intestini TaxID=2563443 RepID=A0A4T0V2C8_9NEIS|nr:class I SAM-dependent methyltransferase [Crenobacter intestini]TIC85316.1 class I SAM-dependent methyltransferase [Crenobacter intestini]